MSVNGMTGITQIANRIAWARRYPVNSHCVVAMQSNTMPHANLACLCGDAAPCISSKPIGDDY